MTTIVSSLQATMPEKKLELFRYVNLRDPRYFKPTPNSTAYTIYDDVEYAMVNKNNRLYPVLKEATANKNLSPDEKVAILLESTKGFRESDEYVSHPEKVNEKYRGYLEFMNSIRELDYSDTNKITRFTEQLIRQTEQDKKHDHLICQAWNNIFVHSLKKTAPVVLHHLLQVVRAAQALRLFKEKISFNSLDITSMIVMLPADIFPVKLFSKEQISPPGDSVLSKKEIENTGTQSDWKTIIESSEDLSRAIRFEREKNLIANPVVSAKPKGKKEDEQVKEIHLMDTITDRILKRINPSSLAFLKKHDLAEPGMRISFVQDELAKILESASKDMASKHPKGHIVFSLNGGIYRLPPHQLQKRLSDVSGNTSMQMQQKASPLLPETEEEDKVYYGFESPIYGPGKPFPEEWLIRPVGIGELKKVEQHVKCYRAGEVAHIENILKGEAKKRRTRRMEKSEDEFHSETETEREEERDTQSTERFDMEKEVETTISRNFSVEAGVNVSANYGVVKVDAYANGAYGQNYQQAQRSSSEFSREVTERTRQRLSTKIKESRTTRIIREFEEKNTHSIDNTNGDGNVVGVYRWVDKIFKAQIVNYGQRLMLQFQIPEPSSFFRFSLSNQNKNNIKTVLKPISPDDTSVFNHNSDFIQTPLTSPAILNATNYLLWAAFYNASVQAPPSEEIVIGKSFVDQPETAVKFEYPSTSQILNVKKLKESDLRYRMTKDEVMIPEGYCAHSYTIIGGKYFGMHPSSGIRVWVGQTYINHHTNLANNSVLPYNGGQLNKERESVPVLFYTDSITGGGFNIKVVCKRTDEAYKNWQMEAYEIILAAYQKQLQDYEAALADLETEQGIQIEGRNPKRNDEVIRIELKRRVIEMMRSAHMHPYASVLTGSTAIKHPITGDYGPWIDTTRAVPEGKYMQFIEHCFEWSNMTWIFYPYFWGELGLPEKNHWIELNLTEDHDPLFAQFLRAGNSRVIVPVRPGFEMASMHFLSTGETWNGEDIPWSGSPLYISIAEETKPTTGRPEGEPWDITLPTDMVILQQQDGGINETGLPCNG